MKHSIHSNASQISSQERRWLSWLTRRGVVAVEIMGVEGVDRGVDAFDRARNSNDVSDAPSSHFISKLLVITLLGIIIIFLSEHTSSVCSNACSMHWFSGLGISSTHCFSSFSISCLWVAVVVAVWQKLTCLSQWRTSAFLLTLYHLLETSTLILMFGLSMLHVSNGNNKKASESIISTPTFLQSSLLNLMISGMIIGIRCLRFSKTYSTNTKGPSILTLVA